MKHLLIFPQDGMEYVSGGSLTCRAGESIRTLGYPQSLVLLLGTAGECRIRVADTELLVTGGSFLLLDPADAPQNALIGQGELTCYRCCFRLPEGARHRILHQRTEDPSVPFFGNAPAPQRAKLLFEQLLEIAHRSSPHRDTLCSMALVLLLSELSATSDTDETTAHGSATAARVTDWIRAHIAEIGSAKDVAAQLGYNCEYLTTLLRKATGKTLTEQIRHARVEKAKDLLLCSALSVKEIAYRCGFLDEKYFLKVFRTAVGATPTQYRNEAPQK